MKDGTTHFAYKAEHAVDVESDLIVAAEIHQADDPDTDTVSGHGDRAHANTSKPSQQ